MTPSLQEAKTKLVIVIPHYKLKDLKRIYANFSGMEKKGINKQMIADWISNLVTADIEALDSF